MSMTRHHVVQIALSAADARQLLVLLQSSTTFPDVVYELREELLLCQFGGCDDDAVEMVGDGRYCPKHVKEVK